MKATEARQIADMRLGIDKRVDGMYSQIKLDATRGATFTHICIDDNEDDFVSIYILRLKENGYEVVYEKGREEYMGTLGMQTRNYQYLLVRW